MRETLSAASFSDTISRVARALASRVPQPPGGASASRRARIHFLWSTFTRFDPAADVHAAAVELVHNHPAFTPPVAIDARAKPGYPAELSCDERTADRVTARWGDYFPAGGVEMGDSERADLD